MIKKIFLLGNPNVGKSVVFSRLTGVEVISSNYPGSTVELTKGYLEIDGEKVEVIDFPGIYSLEPNSEAEKVAISLLQEYSKEEIILVNIIDSTNLERNLFLTLQLIEDGYFLLVCLNMCDDALHRGVDIDTDKLEGLLGVVVIPTCAVTGAGIKLLIKRIKDARSNNKGKLTHQQRWQEIGKIIETVQHLKHRHHTFREALEDASVRPLSGIAMSLGIMFLSFKIIRFLGELMINKISDPVFFKIYLPFLERVSLFLGGKGFLHHLLIGKLIEGKINFLQSLGVLTTAPYIEFAMVLPYIISFYFILSLLEDIGYLPRLAILLDNLLHRIGLHGYAIIPVLLGFGCNVPGILSTRVLESKRERFIAATLISIAVPCVPLQAMIFGLLGKFSGFYVGGVYLVLFSVLVIVGIILNHLLKGYSPEFLLEIPPYRIPPWEILGKKLFFRVKGFIFEAVPVILLGVLAVNILLFFGVFDALTNISAPVIKGLFGLPKEAVVALSVGILRKDAAAGMLMPLNLTVKQLFIAVTLLAVSFPCVATFSVLFKELGFKGLIKSVAVMIFAGLIVGTVLNFGIIH